MNNPPYCNADGTLTFPLYHGTSTFFLARIERTGLGAENIIKKWRVLDFFRDVLAACHRVADPEFKSVIESSKWTNDRILGVTAHNAQGSNWRYGAVYLSADRKKAASYALHSGCGSELLGMALGWHSDLARRDPESANALLHDYPNVARVAAAVPDPIVLEIQGVKVDQIATEAGEVGEPLFSELELWVEMMDIFTKDDSSMANSCFEYTGPPIPKYRLRAFNVSAQAEGLLRRDFSFALRAER